MKKFSKVGKRVMALFIVALMNINTYATQSSNDGSAFVTKAEFDTLMKNFNENMNIYQADLNAKIDAAIAGYISGLSGETSVGQRSIVNEINPKFVNDWVPFASDPGKRYKYFLYIATHWFNNTAGAYQGAEYEVSNDSGDRGSWKYNTSDQTWNGVFVQYRDNDGKFELMNKVISCMVGGVIPCAFGSNPG